MTTAKIKMAVKSNVSKYLLEKLPFLSGRSPKIHKHKHKIHKHKHKIFKHKHKININAHKHKIFFLVFLRQKSFLKLS